MSTDDGSSSRAARLAALARNFYETGPFVDEGYSRLLDRETCQLDAGRVADVITPLFEQRYRIDYDGEGRSIVIRQCENEPHRAEQVPRHEFVALVCELLIALPDPSYHARPRLHRAVQDTRALARYAMPRPPREGNGRPRMRRVKFVTDVVDNLICALEDLPDLPMRLGPRPRRNPAPKPVQAPKPDSAALEATACEFLTALAPVRHPVPDVWTAYKAAIPEAERIGKHRLLALARDTLGEPRKVRGVRFWQVPEPVVLAEVADRVARLAWEEQRAILLRLIAQPTRERTAAA
ncbi:hypothetical protein [Planosporangium mesophilum]|uniref:Uncharacterized protein n=1 Tax=Planosporangium mesophilum TaxID=689768 RepID=A0A8J3X2S0_9ACTN|nr:hypothetical protein [Planosporangium mesophilum]NJC82127.1 hypothetical protein [Planosporangium mesophilum]GII22173.1 hypothetical protein Pme01_17700 [Planosporangium mesophilum]